MKSEQKKNVSYLQARAQRGNAMLYILVALALFGALTVMLGRVNKQNDAQNLDAEMAELRTMELLGYVTSAQEVSDQLVMTGTDVSSIDVVLPNQASFETAPHYNKLFHPLGGGLLYKEGFHEDMQVGADSGWYIQDNINIEWTRSAANDLIISALHIPQDICLTLNSKVGVTTIPTINSTLDNFFDPDGANNNFEIANCAACENYLSLCVEDSAGDYGHYTVLQIL